MMGYRRERIPFKQKVLMGTWRSTGSTRLQNLTVRSFIVFKSMPSGTSLLAYRHEVYEQRSGRVSSNIVAFSFHDGNDMILAA
eukprot:310022-Pelagomonas_calceolata.AAC.1